MLEKILSSANIMFMIEAAGTSLLIAFCALIFGTILGMVGVMCKLSNNKLLRYSAIAYVEFIRGTPMMLQILFFFLGVPALVMMLTGSSFAPDPVFVGIVAISINSGAYSTEMFRSAIQSIDKGQWEAGKALGLSKGKIMRLIIFPQAFRRILPLMVSEFITLIKDSSLVASIGAVELLKSSQILGARYYNYLIPLMFASVVYLAMTLTISCLANKLEKKYSMMY